MEPKIKNQKQKQKQKPKHWIQCEHKKRYENIDCSCLLALTQSPKANLQTNDFIKRRPFKQTSAKTNNDHMNMKIHKSTTATTQKIC